MAKMIIRTDEAYPVYDLWQLPDYDVSPNLREPIVDITAEFKRRFDKVMSEYRMLQDELSEMAGKAEFVSVLDVQQSMRAGKAGEGK